MQKQIFPFAFHIRSVVLRMATRDDISIPLTLSFQVGSIVSFIFYFEKQNPESITTTPLVRMNDGVSSSHSHACCRILRVQQEACNQSRSVWIRGIWWWAKMLSRL